MSAPLFEPITDARRRRMAQDPLEKALLKQAARDAAAVIWRKMIAAQMFINVQRQRPPDENSVREALILLKWRLRVPAIAAFSATTGKRTIRRVQKGAEKQARRAARQVTT